MNKIKVWSFADPLPGDETAAADCEQNPDSVYGYGHYEYIRQVVDCIKHNRKGLVDGLEGRRSLELINAIYESAETGREVFMRFRPKRCRLGHRYF